MISPGAVGQILVVGRHGVFHRVLAGRGAQAHHHAGKGVAEGHAGCELRDRRHWPRRAAGCGRYARWRSVRTCRLRGWRISECNSPRCGTMASNPWYAVNFGGTVSISFGSTTASTGNAASTPIFSWVCSLVTTPHGSTSDPVPAVVVIAMTGSGACSACCSLPVPPNT